MESHHVQEEIHHYVSSKLWSLARVEVNRVHYHQVDVVRLQSLP